ncbi:hypothetical protein BY996DRAFT_6594754 [Phakopsora pachyrhizi]|nr:hypothetical protein BY996DRAFT_6594754 [Phakopsora pachyrhizi]
MKGRKRVRESREVTGFLPGLKNSDFDMAMYEADSVGRRSQIRRFALGQNEMSDIKRQQ